MTPWGPGYRELAVRQHMANVQKAPATNLLSTSSPPEVHGHSPQCARAPRKRGLGCGLKLGRIRPARGVRPLRSLVNAESRQTRPC